jgi:ATP-dependent Clp protease ATP-binding subunit ClpX
MQEIDTSGILFICGGAFVGLDKIIEKRTDARSVGFHSAIIDKNKSAELYQQTTTKDLIQYGLIPEFVGRFGMVVNVDELSIENLVQVLKEPKNSIVKQYQYIFELDGLELEFQDDALTYIAEKAKELKTNARGLKNIIEKTLLPYQFDAVNLVERGLKKIVISKTTVEGNPATLIFDKKVKTNEQN